MTPDEHRPRRSARATALAAGLSIVGSACGGEEAPASLSPAPLVIFDSSCDGNRQASLNFLTVAAGLLIANTSNYMNGHAPRQHAPWEFVFGYWHEERYDFSDAVVDALVRCGPLVTVTLRCDEIWCSGEENALTRVEPDAVVSLCSRFWDLPSLGIGSQAGVLVHELSHVQSCGSTEDFTYCGVDPYGNNTCLAYALLYPDSAVGNADHYELLTETAGNVAWPDPNAEAPPDLGARGQYADFPSVGDIRCDAAPGQRKRPPASAILVLFIVTAALLRRRK